MDAKDLCLKIQDEEKRIMRGLKDFQRATVMRVDELFWKGQNRVLVADEVGLGKTMVARGVIVKMAALRYLENDPLFKVVYVCSNQNIARQNIDKLAILGAKVDKVAETRLSMQHLVSVEQEIKIREDNRYLELIPCTPLTSFKVTNGTGTKRERALMYVILSEVKGLKDYEVELGDLLCNNVSYLSWEELVEEYRERVAKVKAITSEYPKNIVAGICERDEYSKLKQYLKLYSEDVDRKKGKAIIGSLRKMFAELSVDSINPDLVIMDEFQRFSFLLNSNDPEIQLLSDRFLSEKSEDEQDTIRVLLLSATPYKMFSTTSEIDEEGIDVHYKEFFEVVRFLENDDNKYNNFKTIWSNYSHALREANVGGVTLLKMKNKAQDEMYNCMCRTERYSVMDFGDYIDDKSRMHPLRVSEGDVRSYMDLNRLLEKINIKLTLPVDYVKSCPFLMSFMQGYDVKKKIEDYYKTHIKDADFSLLNSGFLWLNKNRISRYEDIQVLHARYERLKTEMFSGKSSYYLWIPPSKPYYKMQGVYKGSSGFSKLLLFSSWEMVPKMTSCLLSYEAERQTIGSFCRKTRQQGHYFKTKNRYPAPRLTFKKDGDKAAAMTIFTLIYPYESLESMYNVIDYLNSGVEDLTKIENDIRKNIRKKLAPFRKIARPSRTKDILWYYFVPMLFDDKGKVLSWIKTVRGNAKAWNYSGKAFEYHLEELEKICNEDLVLGREPDDLENTLVNMVLGSPAVCLLRALKGDKNKLHRATNLALTLLRRFNSPEATSIIDLSYKHRRDDDSHWQDVLHYCKDGNFQAVIDEYLHMMKEGDKELSEEQFKRMNESLNLHSASLDVDFLKDFNKSIRTGIKKYGKSMRSNYAVCFTNVKSEDSKTINRKEDVQLAFNSPFRPFVLSTTSIGQEGLDFHFYCRRIMHWNLPSNPIDLEQREGRINRYKCLAIRQNVAREYGNGQVAFSKDIWEEMFKAAENNKQRGISDLVPYWCFGKNQKIKIERILPFYPMSRDYDNYSHLTRILANYRLTLGQPRQEELLEYILKEAPNEDTLKNLFINLSPYDKKCRKKRS